MSFFSLAQLPSHSVSPLTVPSLFLSPFSLCLLLPFFHFSLLLLLSVLELSEERGGVLNSCSGGETTAAVDSAMADEMGFGGVIDGLCPSPHSWHQTTSSLQQWPLLPQCSHLCGLPSVPTKQHTQKVI